MQCGCGTVHCRNKRVVQHNTNQWHTLFWGATVQWCTEFSVVICSVLLSIVQWIAVQCCTNKTLRAKTCNKSSLKEILKTIRVFNWIRTHLWYAGLDSLWYRTLNISFVPGSSDIILSPLRSSFHSHCDVTISGGDTRLEHGWRSCSSFSFRRELFWRNQLAKTWWRQKQVRTNWF